MGCGTVGVNLHVKSEVSSAMPTLDRESSASARTARRRRSNRPGISQAKGTGPAFRTLKSAGFHRRPGTPEEQAGSARESLRSNTEGVSCTRACAGPTLRR
jgi:hypothetical protein